MINTLKRYWMPLCLLAAFAVIYGYRLDVPKTEYFDEVYHVKTAREYLTWSGNTDTVHPPLAKFAVSCFMRLLGDRSWVWRLLSYLCSMGTLVIFYRLAEKLLKDSMAALMAAAFLAMDGLFMTQARITMHNSAMLFCMLMAIWFMVRGLEKHPEGDRAFIYSGIFLGLTIACRWVAAGVLPVMGLIFLYFLPRMQNKKEFFEKSPLFYLIVPALVYFSIHFPLLFLKGYGTLESIWRYQVTMLDYHHKLVATHPYSSDWWSWPVMIRPIWYHFQKNSQGLIEGILCIGNPALMWGFFPALGYLAWRSFKERCVVSIFIILGFLSQWLPWAVIGRVKFYHYYYTAVPFIALGMAVYLRAIWTAGRWGKVFTAFYILLVAGMFFYWYPLLAAYPVTDAFYGKHMWFRSWI